MPITDEGDVYLHTPVASMYTYQFVFGINKLCVWALRPKRGHMDSANLQLQCNVQISRPITATAFP